MDTESLIDKALQDELSEEQWKSLLANPDMRRELELQLGMDALLRVTLNPGQMLPRAIEASLGATATEDLMLGIEQATLGRRQRHPRWLGVRMPHWKAAAAAVVAGLLSGFFAWPESASTWVGSRRDAPTGSATVVITPPAQESTSTRVMVETLLKDETWEYNKPTVADAGAASANGLPAPQPQVPSPVPPETASPKVPTTTMAAASSTAPDMEAEMPRMQDTLPPPMNLAKPAPEVPLSMPEASSKVDFEKHVLPIFERACFECHSAKQKKPKGGIRLDDLEQIRDKSRSDNLVLPHKPEKSTLVKSISLPVTDEALMPPPDSGRPLTAEEIVVVRRWVEEGANFGGWTSMRAKSASISTEHETVDTTKAQAVAARIDELIQKDLAAHGEEPRPFASETTWLRRVYLDLIGRIPSSTEARQFLQSKDPSKRARLVDQLLASNGHTSHMFNFWCDLLRAKDRLADGVQGDFYLAWIKQSVRDNKPFDAWTRELLTPAGYGWRAPAAGYYLRDGENRAANIESTATLFLGTQISCAQCHDHPYARWTRKDYHQFLAWTSGIKTASSEDFVGSVEAKEIKEAEDRYDRLSMSGNNYDRQQKYGRIRDALQSLQRAAGGAGVVNGEGGTGVLPEDYQYPDGKPGELIQAAVLYGETPRPSARPADTLAEWITTPQNTRFSLTLANRLWHKLFGSPVAGRLDQVREIADCDNPDLAHYLANMVRDARYDVRQILRIYCLTQAYQRESAPLPADPDLVYRFPGPVMRRLSAEQVWDSMMSLAVQDLDKHLSFEAPGVEILEAAVEAKKASEVTAAARKMAAAEEREMKAEQRRARLRQEVAAEFAGGGLERASELPQPTPEGHFLRMFGQGGREFIGDSWSASTVPQALLMLNSDFFDHVARSGSPLAESLRGLNNTRDVARGAFLAVLTREPTEAELTACQEALGDGRNPKALARTLLSTAEFVFQK